MTTTRKYEEIEFGFIEKIDSEGFHEKVTEMILTCTYMVQKFIEIFGLENVFIDY